MARKRQNGVAFNNQGVQYLYLILYLDRSLYQWFGLTLMGAGSILCLFCPVYHSLPPLVGVGRNNMSLS